MERLSPISNAEPALPGAGGTSALRTTIYAGLALILAAGAWVRFNDDLATVAPGLAAPAAAARQATSASALHPLLEQSLVPRSDEAAAVAALGLPTADAAAMLDALRRDRLRLVQLPLFDAGSALPGAAEAGHVVLVSSAGFSRMVRIGRTPVPVTLPIDRAGTVSFQVAAGEAKMLPDSGLGIGAVTLVGPVPLPHLHAGEQLDVGVVAQ